MCTFIQVPSHKPYTYIIFNHLVLFALAVFVLNFWGVTVMKHYPMSERQIKKFSVLLHHQIESMKETELRQCLWKDKVFNRNSLHALAIIETYFTRLLPSSFIWTLSLLWYLLNEQFIITMPCHYHVLWRWSISVLSQTLSHAVQFVVVDNVKSTTQHGPFTCVVKVRHNNVRKKTVQSFQKGSAQFPNRKSSLLLVRHVEEDANYNGKRAVYGLLYAIVVLCASRIMN